MKSTTNLSINPGETLSNPDKMHMMSFSFAKFKILVLSIVLGATISTGSMYGQGCVAIRPMVCGAGGHTNQLGLLTKGEWQASGTYQYFHSFRHFRGDIEEHERIENGTQVENLSHSVDLSLTTALTNRVSLTLNIPYLYYDRSSLYEHYGNSINSNPDQLRFHTKSSGIGDTRITGSYWLFNPEKESLNGNISAGLGLKIPTGNENVQGDFHKLSDSGMDSIVTKPVDQSIQLGDGGWGFSVEVQGFWKLFNKGWGYFNGFYLFNPESVNKTLTRGTLDGANPIIAYHSVADQFAASLGLNYGIWPEAGLSISLGGRIEGVPSHDVIGDSNGYRRPGYVVAMEPGLSYMYRHFNLNFNMPIALYRNRTKSVYDLSDPTGNRHGDAAFADVLYRVSLVYRFGGNFEQGSIPVLN